MPVNRPTTTYERAKKAAQEWEAGVPAQDIDINAMVAYVLSEKAEKYAKDNPLGGPAKMFEAIASRIRAGEDYYAVLDDYDLQHKSPPSATEAKWRMGMAALEQRIHNFIRTNPRDLDDWREEMDVLRTLVKAYRETSPVSPAAAPEAIRLLREIGDMFGDRLDVPYPKYLGATQSFLTIQLQQLRERIDAVAPQPQAATTEDADCATCEGDPEICAKVPGLRHCEKAMRSVDGGNAGKGEG